MTSRISRITILLTLLLTTTSTIMAQRLNRLWIPECGGPSTTTIQVYINLDNTDQATGFQFDLTAPSGYKFGSEFTKTDRLGDTHSVAGRLIAANQLRIIGYASDNASIRGNSGSLGYVTLTIPSNAVQGSEHEITISNATLGNADMDDILTETVNGRLTIEQMPDLEVSDVATTAINANPGDELTVSWAVANIGTRSYRGNWGETVKAVGPDGRIATLYTGYADVDGLAGNSSISREAKVTIPNLPGIDGDVSLLVEVTPGSDSGESQSTSANNSAQSSMTFSLGKHLVLTSDMASINENGYRVKFTLSRSGSWANNQTFTIVNSHTSRMWCPATVAIGANSSSVTFYAHPTDNQMFDGDATATITVSGDDYEPVDKQIKIIDNEKPDFEITVVIDNVTEGKNFPLKIDLGCELPTTTIVNLATNSPNLIDLPPSVEIPTGTSSVTLAIPTHDNPEINGNATAAIIATTEQYGSSSDAVTIVDKDMPALSMQVSADVLYQGGDEGEFYVTISRASNIDTPLQIALTDNSNDLLTYANASIEMGAGETEVTIPLSVADKKISGGKKECTLTAAVLIKGCSCSATTESAGNVSKKLTIIDPNQKRLTLTCLDVLTAKTCTRQVTLRRNIDIANDLTVSLSAPYPIVMPTTITIPAGMESVTFDAQLSEAFTEGAGAVMATAKANGYYNGSCLMPYTAERLPDASIRIAFESDQLTAGEKAKLLVTIRNNGDAPMPLGTPVSVTSKGIKEPIDFTLTSDLHAGESAIYNFEVEFIDAAATFNVIGRINESKAVKEAIYANNATNIYISTTAPFTVTTSTDKASYLPGETITISGQAQGEKSANQSIDVYIMGNNGSFAQSRAVTDANGEFTYTTEAKQCGTFNVIACYPGAIPDKPQTSYDVIGLRIDTRTILCDLTQNVAYEGEITLTNPTSVEISHPLISRDSGTIIKDINISIGSIASIAPNTTIKVPFTITAHELTPTNETIDLGFTVFIDNRDAGHMTMRYRVRPQTGRIEADEPRIDIAVVNGEPRDYTFNIINSGSGETGTITLSLPDEVKSLTPLTLVSLKPGEIAPVSLRFTPSAKSSEALFTQGTIAINCAQGIGLSMPFKMTQVSTEVGKIKLKVTDEYAYYDAAGERIEVESVFDRSGIAGANVELTNALIGELALTATADEQGYVEADITGGHYTLNVSAPNHSSLTANVRIEPGIDNELEAFCSYTAIQYSWQVTETEVEDSYEMKTVAEFTTMVPKPVVTIDYPEDGVPILQPFYITVTNHGLIKAYDVNAELTVDGDFTLVPLNDTYLDVIEAGETVEIEAVLIPNELLADLANKQSSRRKLPSIDTEKIIGWIMDLSEIKDAIDNIRDLYWMFYCYVIDTKLTMKYEGCRHMDAEEHKMYARMNKKCYDDPDSPGLMGNIIHILAPKNTSAVQKPGNNGGGGSFAPNNEFAGGGGSAYEILPDIMITNGPCSGRGNAQPHVSNLVRAMRHLDMAPTKAPDDDDATCASILLEFKQKIALTRQAFRGSLTILNGMPTPMEGIKVMLTITDSECTPVTAHIIDTSTESIDGFSVDANGLWTVEAEGAGTANYLFIPTVNAAPTKPTVYSFGGYLSFIDPQTGMNKTLPLRPVEMTVEPTPEFDLTYFMQRDVFGDDPLTDNIEPSVPAEFSLLVNNVGNGEAKSMKVTTAQPQIVENEKGLNITYSIVSAQLNGADHNLTLGQSITTDFGSIPAHSTAYAQWWMESSLLGHFVEYDFSINHVTSHGNPSLSLIRNASMHELIRGLRFTDADGKPQRAFLVNDLADDESHPDAAYLTDGTTCDVFYSPEFGIKKY